MPKISIIMPIYNVEKYINRCIDSILAQTFKDFELILIDDGSPDNCPQIIEEYAKKDNRIITIHKQNEGVGKARNTGLEWVHNNSDSEWISWIDSDDWVHPQYLERLYNVCVENNLKIAECAFYEAYSLDDNNKARYDDEYVVYSSDDFWSTELGDNFLWNKLSHRSLWDGLEFPSGIIYEDMFVVYKLIFRCDRVAYIPSQMYFYYRNTTGYMMSCGKDLQKLEAMLDAIKVQLEFLNENGYEKSYYRWGRLYLTKLNDIMYENKKVGNNEAYKRQKKLFDSFIKQNAARLDINKKNHAEFYFIGRTKRIIKEKLKGQ